MLKKPQKGGNIIIDEKIYNVEKNDLWLILASLKIMDQHQLKMEKD